MTTTTIILIALAFLILILNLIAALLGNKNKGTLPALDQLEKRLKDEFIANRNESHTNAKESREEVLNSVTKLSSNVTTAITNVTNIQNTQLESVANNLAKNANNSTTKLEAMHNNAQTFAQNLLNMFETKLADLNALTSQTAAINREEQSKALLSFENKFTTAITNYKSDTTLQLDKIGSIVDNNLKDLQKNNNDKLEQMRATVDEKLTATLEKRFNESFKFISERLEQVHKGLGEMQTIAQGVGDLKKVMSNVKTRGVFGEYQLQNILEDLLTSAQYQANVKPIPHKGTTVEFAIKMPDNNNLDVTLWMPIDSKFPKEDYEALTNAYDDGDADKVKHYQKTFRTAILKCAKDINEKYLEPPYTTDFGIMFLPFESLYAEVLRMPTLFDEIQRLYKVTICGPTTLAALLNSLQMGFKTLTIQKRSSEVWGLLDSVKTEFKNYNLLLEKTKKHITAAGNSLDFVGTRTRVIEKKLNGIALLPEATNTKLVEIEIATDMNNLMEDFDDAIIEEVKVEDVNE